MGDSESQSGYSEIGRALQNAIWNGTNVAKQSHTYKPSESSGGIWRVDTHTWQERKQTGQKFGEYSLEDPSESVCVLTLSASFPGIPLSARQQNFYTAQKVQLDSL